MNSQNIEQQEWINTQVFHQTVYDMKVQANRKNQEGA
jgi:hypothetical protein